MTEREALDLMDRLTREGIGVSASYPVSAGGPPGWSVRLAGDGDFGLEGRSVLPSLPEAVEGALTDLTDLIRALEERAGALEERAEKAREAIERAMAEAEARGGKR